MQLFCIQMPKASGTSVLGCMDPPLTAKTVSDKGCQSPSVENLGTALGYAFTFISREEFLCNSPQRCQQPAHSIVKNDKF